MSEAEKTYKIIYGDYHKDGIPHVVDKTFNNLQDAKSLFERLDVRTRFEGFRNDQDETVLSCFAELGVIGENGLLETLDYKRWPEKDYLETPECKGLPEGWVWSDLAARRIAGSDLAYGLAERMVGNPDAKIDDLIQEQAAPAMDRAELFEWAMADVANLAAVEDVFDNAGYTEEPFESFTGLIEGAYRQTSRAELENCIDQIQKAALYLKSSEVFSPSNEVERMALSPALIREINGFDCSEQAYRFDDLIESFDFQMEHASDILPDTPRLDIARTMDEARTKDGDFILQEESKEAVSLKDEGRDSMAASKAIAREGERTMPSMGKEVR